MTIYKHYAKNLYYHVYSRGNQKQPIFHQDADYQRFIKKIEEYQKKYKVDILAYCLMPNHFHFLLYQPTKLNINKFMQALLVSHIRYFQKKYNLIGHLFQGRFRAKIVDSEHYLLQLSRYIHQNPLEAAGNYSDAYLNSYPWSSYYDYVGKRPLSFVDPDIVLKVFSKMKKSPKLSYQTLVQTPFSDMDNIEI